MDCILPHSQVRVQPLQGVHLDQEGKHFLAGEDAVLVDISLLKQGCSMCQGMLLQQSSLKVEHCPQLEQCREPVQQPGQVKGVIGMTANKESETARRGCSTLQRAPTSCMHAHLVDGCSVAKSKDAAIRSLDLQVTVGFQATPVLLLGCRAATHNSALSYHSSQGTPGCRASRTLDLPLGSQSTAMPKRVHAKQWYQIGQTPAAP